MRSLHPCRRLEPGRELIDAQIPRLQSGRYANCSTDVCPKQGISCMPADAVEEIPPSMTKWGEAVAVKSRGGDTIGSTVRRGFAAERSWGLS
jgi:hypothetical protein